ncbi:hypothetical protein [Vulcanisaeta distributa]|uniref:Uncharacterized protein n=1 Tax=Vulcanisaeta distributa (strain DSM 14429 / JCM 11212 / NBRC 100878 / IC-017) TaxID=572478 RepID=E1QPQ3_VULDI|nr:hypothetical protein [Vulcanisaeta distributa]ADN50349.1 hypothetical protein Vdis_0959 [Vulcanisaeta distributa DSM 14429]
MIIEIKRFRSLNELIQTLKGELGNSYRFMYMLKQNWNEILGSENNTALASEISENIRFVDGSLEVFSLRIVYKPGTNTKSNVINDVAGYIQRRSAIIKSVIDRLEALNIDKNRPIIALLVDSIPAMIIVQNEEGA